MSTDKTWKDHLLSSGLPFEYSVYENLRSLGFPSVREYTYERVNEVGIPMPFSVDLYATLPCGLQLDFWLDLLVECKYRHDTTRWVFFPEPDTPLCGCGDALVTMESISGRDPVSSKQASLYADTLPLCSKGIEILPKEANPKSIREGVQQLRFGLVDRLGAVLEEQFGPLPSQNDWGWVIVPVLVTTAEIWCMRHCLAAEAVRTAETIDEVALRSGAILLHQEPDPELSNHTVLRLSRAIASDRVGDLDFAMKARGYDSYADYVRNLARCVPRFFFVVQYNALWDLVDGLLRLLAPSFSEQRDREYQEWARQSDDPTPPRTLPSSS